MIRSLACLLLLSGCKSVYRVNTTPYTISTRPEIAAGFETIGPVSATYCNRVIFVIPILGKPSTVFDVLTTQATQMGGVAVTDVRLTPVNYVQAPFYFKMCFQMTGNAVRLKPVAPPPPPPATRKKKK